MERERIMSLTGLPAELLFGIASYLSEESDLLSLLLLNRRTHSLLHSTLYTYNVRHNHSSALIWAATYNRVTTAAHSLNHGADTHVRASLCRSKNTDGDGNAGGIFGISGNGGVGGDTDSYPYTDTPFSLAAKGGNAEVLRLLIEWNGGIVPLALERAAGLMVGRGVPLLALAAERGHLGVVRMLLEEFGEDKRVYVDAVDGMGRTVLARAAMAATRMFGAAIGVAEEGEGQEKEGAQEEMKNRALTLIRLLLEHGADLESADAYGRTPLALVAICTRTGRHCVFVARLLMEHGADANREDQYGRTLLAIAAGRGCAWLVRLLLEYCSNDGRGGSMGKVDVNARDHNRLTPLSHAAMNGHEEIVRLLLQQGGADPDPADIHGCTPLSWAAERGWAGIVRMLLEHPLPADVNHRSKDADRSTPLIKSVGSSETIVRLLLTLGKDPDINALSADGMPLLSLAVTRGNVQPDNGNVYALLEHEGLIADQRDKKGMTALMHAASFGEYEIVEALMSREDVDVNSRDHAGKTPLCHVWPSATKRVEIVRLLLEHGADVNASDDSGRTLFSGAWESRALDLMEFLFEAGAEPMWVNNSKSDIDTHADADADADPNDERGIHRGQLFQLAMEIGHAKMVKRALVMLVDDGIADPTIRQDEYGRTPLCVAAIRGLDEVVRVLLAHSSSNNNERTAQPLALALAAMNGYDEIVRQLLAAGVNDSDSSHEYMYLLQAMDRGYQEVVKMFMDLHQQAHSARIADSPPYYPPWLPLFLAALYGHVEVVKTLMASHSVSVAKMMMGMQNDKVEKTKGGKVEWNGVVDLTPLWLAAEHVWATGGTETSVVFMQYRPKS